MNRLITTLTMVLIFLAVAALPIARALADPFDAGPAAENVIDVGEASPEVAGSSEPDNPSEAKGGPASGELAPGVGPGGLVTDPVSLTTDIVNDVRAGDWRHAVAGLLALIMFILGKFREDLPLFSGDRGGAILVGLLGFGGGISTWLLSDAALDWRLFLGSQFVVFSAVGGVTWLKRLFWPKDRPTDKDLKLIG